MVVTTDSSALRARFDMLFSEEMKSYVKEQGGGAYIRNLVLQDLLAKLSATSRLSTRDKERIARMYDTEILRMEGQVA